MNQILPQYLFLKPTIFYENQKQNQTLKIFRICILNKCLKIIPKEYEYHHEKNLISFVRIFTLGTLGICKIYNLYKRKIMN